MGVVVWISLFSFLQKTEKSVHRHKIDARRAGKFSVEVFIINSVYCSINSNMRARLQNPYNRGVGIAVSCIMVYIIAKRSRQTKTNQDRSRASVSVSLSFLFLKNKKPFFCLLNNNQEPKKHGAQHQE